MTNERDASSATARGARSPRRFGIEPPRRASRRRRGWCRTLAGAFVTLHTRGTLRGCIGHSRPTAARRRGRARAPSASAARGSALPPVTSAELPARHRSLASSVRSSRRSPRRDRGRPARPARRAGPAPGAAPAAGRHGMGMGRATRSSRRPAEGGSARGRLASGGANVVPLRGGGVRGELTRADRGGSSVVQVLARPGDRRRDQRPASLAVALGCLEQHRDMPRSAGR